ncbi:hypothetical protein BO83DRAFT_434221 [Aspergillus eucalypticola CBS 122712]|uniref:Zn(2)-C6 fungal-type domain-containing protein n=1 Tax=Aspergillus eucalypticola (strain CBS 122712 / IBT 29274) TaxID=1448314 RepID=A0A317W7G3_ASPEC|nr:uncharacterized protein BO83DRAFT_434221 [Aspergillus eucalypticola CBS 122712]PWY82584.1 hypothetical protein BO83DRAFT_434221 [Aspergillus eucalypticola CBS 122712]
MLGNSTSTEHRRKRVRKGTKSCWACKRRKIKCIPQPESPICAGCRERNTPCISQAFEDDDSLDNVQDSPLARRMARVESLLERLMETITHGQTSGGLTPAALSATAIPPQSILASPLAGGQRQDEASPLSEKLGVLRHKLARMLPCQADVDSLFQSSHGWWLIQQHIMTHLAKSTHSMFDVNVVAQGHPITITRLLLCIAICIQQLPPDADVRYPRAPVAMRKMRRNITEFLVQNVTSDDELITSVDGIECLALLGIYEVNAGNLRRSWVSYRKAVTLSHLLGLHRVTVRASSEEHDSMNTRRGHLWYQVARGERYLSTLLGVPSATGSAVLPLDDSALWLSPEDVYHKHLYHIAGLILARNQEDATHSFSTTQRVCEMLEVMANRMPATWWEVPTQISSQRTAKASQEFERLMCHIWHFELEHLLHLPFMLRATTDRRYEYCRVSCLNACRNLIKRWLAIRESRDAFYFSNLLEFEAFTAATSLLLGLLGPRNSIASNHVQERQEDSQLVETVVRRFETQQQQGCGMQIGDQSISVIHTLQRFLHDESLSCSLRLQIPFFGTIKVTRSGALQPLEGERILGASTVRDDHTTRSAQLSGFFSSRTVDHTPNQASGPARHSPQGPVEHQCAPSPMAVPPNGTILQFFSDHLQLPEESSTQDIVGLSDWPYDESDTIFFDSLVNTDLVGNWTI